MSEANAYSRTQIVLHWLIAAMVVFEIVMHEGVESAFRAQRNSGFALTPLDPAYWANPHVLVGSLILVLMVWRLVLRLTRKGPAAPSEEPIVLQWDAKLAHAAFYVVLILMPISGTMQYLTGNRTAHTIHEFGEPVIIGLVLIHIAAALVHQFWWKTDVLKRMVGRA